MHVIDFVARYLLIRSLLLLLFRLDFGFSTLGVCTFGMVLLIVTLCFGLGRVCSIDSITLGSGISVIDASVCGGLVVLSKVTCSGSVGADGSSGVGSGSGALLRISFSCVNASISDLTLSGCSFPLMLV